MARPLQLGYKGIKGFLRRLFCSSQTKHPQTSCQTSEGKKGLSPEVEGQLTHLLHGLPAEQEGQD